MSHSAPGSPRHARRRLTFERLQPRAMLSVNGDFNGDGFDDLAIGAPLDDQGALGDSGAVHILYGTAGGLSAVGAQTWTQDSAGVKGKAEAGDRFGAALAVGDFDGDGFDDLAIGAPGEAIGSTAGAGMVTVLYGSAGGLTAAGDQAWHQNSAGIKGACEADENFGMALAAGDFDGDGRDDLAIGVLDEHTVAQTDCGKVAVIYGSAGGLTDVGDQLWYQASPGMQGASEANDRFGACLAAGDFNGDGRDDLAIGVPGEDVGAVVDAGAVHVMYGSAWGLSTAGNHCSNENEIGVDASEAGDLFGSALAAGDFNDDGFDDLAVGAPGENGAGAGAVTILYGADPVLTFNLTQHFRPNNLGFANNAGAQFGAALAAGDFDGDGAWDLAVGAPFDNLVGPQIGIVYIIYGADVTGLTAVGAQRWSQDTAMIEGAPIDQDRFGAALTTGDYNDDGHADLAVGVPGDDDSGVNDSGSVNVIYGTAAGLDATGDQIWDQEDLGGTSESGDDFGAALG